MLYELPHPADPPVDAKSTASPCVTLADPTVRRLAAILAHTINNSLTGVIGYLELALREAPAETDKRKNLQAGLGCAFQAANAVRRIVGYLLRPREAQAVSKASLREIARSAVANAVSTYANFPINWEVHAEAPCLIEENALVLLGVLEQVFANAVEAMPNGGQVTVTVWEDEGSCHLAVSDTGPGLAPMARDHLFEPFMTTKTTGHLGLGLAICREMLEAQGEGRRLEITSAPGQGMTATVICPAEKRVAADANPLESRWQSESPHCPKPPVGMVGRPAEAAMNPVLDTR